MRNCNTLNVTEPDFRKTFFSCRKCRKYAGKPDLLAFSRDLIFIFIRLFALRCVLDMFKMWPSRIFEKNFFPAENAGNMPEIAVFVDFHRTFSYLSLFFHAKTLLITMPTIKHGSIVNKTDFCSRNSLKIAEKAVFLEFLELYFIFFS